MKEISYSRRASFDEFESEDSAFLRQLIKRLNIHSALEIPCANGRNVDVLGNTLSKVYFADINASMVTAVHDKIVKGQKQNCKALVMDLIEVSAFPYEVDAIFIMQQAFQMLSFDSGKKALLNLYGARYRYLVIDIYDFLCEASDLPYYLHSDKTFVDSANTIWTRHSFIVERESNQINLRHEYASKNETLYTNISLQNYSRGAFITLCEECGYRISDYYSNYRFGKCLNLGRNVFILVKKEGGSYDASI